jgi:hypothetical protein
MILIIQKVFRLYSRKLEFNSAKQIRKIIIIILIIKILYQTYQNIKIIFNQYFVSIINKDIIDFQLIYVHPNSKIYQKDE